MIMSTPIAAKEIPELRGIIEFEDARAIPEGRIRVQLNQPTDQNRSKSQPIETQIASNGKSEKLDFSLPLPLTEKSSAAAQIVVTLERKDGWLLARGSAKVDSSGSTHIVLYTVMY